MQNKHVTNKCPIEDLWRLDGDTNVRIPRVLAVFTRELQILLRLLEMPHLFRKKSFAKVIVDVRLLTDWLINCSLFDFILLLFLLQNLLCYYLLDYIF